MVMIPPSLRGTQPAPTPAGTRVAPTVSNGPQGKRGVAPPIAIERVEVSAYTIPTEQPESDGTHEWTSTTLVVVHVHAAGFTGMGYTYAHPATALIIQQTLAPLVKDADPTATSQIWQTMANALRNDGVQGIGAAAISAVDNAVWDLKARLLGIPLVSLLGQLHDSIPVYGSGGFTSYDESKLRRQLEGWVEQGIRGVKIKVGRDPASDVPRVELARRAIGDDIELFVDANGAYSRKQALRMAHDLAVLGVSWFEEPVTSDDLRGLRLLRERAPAGMEIAAGEYGYTMHDFRRMINAGAVDVIQPDVTRCMGITGFLAVAALADAANISVSAHTAPAQSLHVCCAVRPFRHIEWFHDHIRIEQMLFDGFPRLEKGGMVRPDTSLPGNGLTLRRSDAEQYRVQLTR